MFRQPVVLIANSLGQFSSIRMCVFYKVVYTFVFILIQAWLVLCYFYVVNGIYNVDLAGHPIGSDPMYPGRMPMQGQPQGGYPMNTGPRAVDHTGYPMNHNMMSQGGQMGYRTTQSAMPGPNRMGPFASSVSPNAVVGANNNPQMISSMNAHPGAGQYPMGMMNRPQQQQQMQQQMQHQQQQSMMGMSPNPGGMRMGAQNMGTHLGPISTSGDSTPFQPPISGNNMGMYNRSPNPGGSIMGQNSAVAAQAAGQKRSSLSPYQSQYRTATAYSPNSTPPGGPTQPPFQGTPPPPPSYNSSNNSLPSVNQASTYQVVPPNQTAPNNSNQLPLPSAAGAQEASNSPRSGPGTPTVATSTVHTHDLVTSQLSPLPVVANDTTITVTSSQKSSNTDLAASSSVSQEVSNASQGSTPQVSPLVLYVYLISCVLPLDY